LRTAIIAVDFDGILIEDGHWPGIGPEVPGAIAGVNALHKSGHCIIINSCRVGEAEANMIRWLIANNVKFCHINRNCVKRQIYYKTDCRKISADIYIDDKNLCFILNPLDWITIVGFVIGKFGGNIERDCEFMVE